MRIKFHGGPKHDKELELSPGDSIRGVFVNYQYAKGFTGIPQNILHYIYVPTKSDFIRQIREGAVR